MAPSRRAQTKKGLDNMKQGIMSSGQALLEKLILAKKK